MNRLLFLWVIILSQYLCSAQISFLKEINPEAKLREIDAPLVLSNGNIVISTRMDSFPEVDGPNFNRIFLFDECGNLLTKTHLSQDGTDVVILDLIENTDGNILCSAFFSGDFPYKLYTVLDKNDLSIIQNKRFFSANIFSQHLNIENGEIYEYSSSPLLGFSQLKEASLSRKFNLYKTEHDENVRSKQFAYATRDKMCYVNNYNNANSNYTSSYECLDKYLNTIYNLKETHDSLVFSIITEPIHLGSDVVLLSTSQRDLAYTEYKHFIKKYKRDSLIFSKQVPHDEFYIGIAGICLPTSEKIYCVSAEPVIKEFDLNGNWLGNNTNLMDTLLNDELYHIVITKENVIVGADINWVYDEYEEKWTSYLKLFKTNDDFDIPYQSEVPCINSVLDVEESIKCNLFPNPSLNGFVVESDIPLKSYTLINQAGTVVLSKQCISNQNSISFEKLKAGFYILHLISQNNISMQKKVIAIE